MPFNNNAESAATTLVEDRYGNLWIGTTYGLGRRSPDGRIEWYKDASSNLPNDIVNALIIDRRGDLWAGSLSAGDTGVIGEYIDDTNTIAQITNSPFAEAFQMQVSGSLPSGVPEPASLALWRNRLASLLVVRMRRRRGGKAAQSV